MEIKKALILAGGNGTRLGCTDNPKPMYTVGGVPVLERTLMRLSNFGVEKAYISVKYKKEKIIDYFGSKYKDIEIVYTEGKDTIGHSIVEALKDEEDTVICVYGDTVTDLTWDDFVKSHEIGNKHLTVMAVPTKDVKCYGLITQHPESKEYKFTSKYHHGKTGPGLVDAGHFVITPHAYNVIKENDLDSIDSLLIEMQERNGGFHVHEHHGRWIDLNLPEYYEAAQELFKD